MTEVINGSQPSQQNIQYSWDKGRREVAREKAKRMMKWRHALGYVPFRRGEAHTEAKLTESDVRQIRASPLSSEKAGEMFGVAGGTVRSIRRRKTWRHII